MLARHLLRWPIKKDMTQRGIHPILFHVGPSSMTLAQLLGECPVFAGESCLLDNMLANSLKQHWFNVRYLQDNGTQ